MKMTLYLSLRQLISPIGEYVLDREFMISRQEEPKSDRPVLEGNTILLPFYFDFREVVGRPHAKISPLDDTSAQYTHLVEVERSFLVSGPDRRYQPLHRNDQIKLSIPEGKRASDIILIGELFSLRLTKEPTYEAYWADFKPKK